MARNSKNDSSYEAILDAIADGVFTTDQDHRILSFNRAAERITGVPREQAIGRKCFDVLCADVCQSACTLRTTMETGRPIINQHVTILNSDGRRVPISISTAVLRDAQGKVIGGAETFRDLSDLELLRREIENAYVFEDIISKNHRMREMFRILPDIAESDSTVLIEGPSGTGKELVARALHNLSARSNRPFIAVNCAALPDTLIESELFGYVQGAFTDAKRDKPGRLALAEGGTLFLDEVGDISVALQVKLLRVLQEKRYEPLGATRSLTANVRVITATNRPLADRVARGEFREDLYYRLNVIRLTLPPLTERKEDIPLLVDHFLRRLSAEKGKLISGVTPGALEVLLRHAFPGNVRELENVLEHAFVLCRGSVIDRHHLPPELAHLETARPETRPSPLETAEAEAIRAALARHPDDRQAAADELGIHRTTLWRKARRLGLL